MGGSSRWALCCQQRRWQHLAVKIAVRQRFKNWLQLCFTRLLQFSSFLLINQFWPFIIFRHQLFSVLDKWFQESYQYFFIQFNVEFKTYWELRTAIIILYILRGFRIVSFPRLSRDIPRKLFPLPLLYLANMLTGLKSTKSLSLPMFTVLRRFSILLTMLMEFLILKELLRSYNCSQITYSVYNVDITHMIKKDV